LLLLKKPDGANLKNLAFGALMALDRVANLT
jgi:hypothetical protein